MSKIYYSQRDSRWARHPYPSSKHPSATIKSGGCGPTSTAMIISSLAQTIYPNQMGDMFRANGFRAAEGSDPRGFLWAANKYGLKMTKSIYLKDAINCLKDGGMVIAHLYNPKKSLFSTGGHYVVLADYRNGTIIVYDPNLYSGKFASGNRRKVTVVGVECRISEWNFKHYNDYNLYCFKGNKVTPTKYKAGQAVEIDVPITLTGAETPNPQVGGVDIMVDDGRGKPTSQYWVHKSVVKNNHIIARATICFGSGTDYMVQVFNRQFWITEKAIKKVL